MQLNIGRNDRWIRVVLGVILLVAAVATAGVLRWVTGIIGVVLLATAVAGYCPIYGACHISTTGPSKG